MASWTYQFRGTKADVSAALSAATIADAVDYDAPAEDLVGNEAATAHFNAAIASAQSQLAALTGNAPFAGIVATGYYDPNVTAPLPNARGSQISVLVAEYWS